MNTEKKDRDTPPQTKKTSINKVGATDRQTDRQTNKRENNTSYHFVVEVVIWVAKSYWPQNSQKKPITKQVVPVMNGPIV